MNPLYYILLICFLFLIGFVVFQLFLSGKRQREELTSGLDMTLFLVLMPRYENKKDELMKQDEKMLIGQMEQIFSSFLYLKKPGFIESFFKKPYSIAFEIASEVGGNDISFYVAVPKYLETSFEKYVHGVYPRAIVEKVPDDYTIFEPSGKVSGSFMKLKEIPVLPINTYKNFEKDPLSGITNTLSKIAADEGAAIQVVIRSVSQPEWRINTSKMIGKLKAGKNLMAAYRESTRSWFGEMMADLFSNTSGQKDREKQQNQMYDVQTREQQADQALIEAIQYKNQKQVFEANIRLLASAQSQERAEEILLHLEGVFGQFSLASFNSFKANQIKKGAIKNFIHDYSFRRFNEKQKSVLNIEELTSVYHFPTRFIETPYIKDVKSVVAAPPPGMAKDLLNVLGEVDFRGDKSFVGFSSRNDRRRHCYIIGQTGVGKSGLLREMIRQDIANGEGVAVIDPHGDLVEDTLANIPKERAEDVVLFEPFDLERPVGLNMLECETLEQKDFAAQEMISIFYKLFPPEIIGPMFEHYMRNAMLALMSDKDDPGTLVEIPRMFTDPAFLDYRLEKVTDPVVRNFWIKEWKQTTGETRSDMLGYVVSKVGRFIENEMMRNIIGQSRSGVDLAKVMDEKKIFLANLSKGLTGEVNSSLLGLILVSKMQMAAMRRARVPENQRQDFYLYVDEFQNFTTDSIATILSEARKYKLNLILAHQYMPQLTDQIRNAVLGNVGTMGTFRVGADDAEYLEKQFEPEFSRFDLVNLDNFQMIAKIMIDNKVSSPFKFKTFPPREGNREIVDPVKKIAKLKYGRPKAIIEAEIAKRSKLF